MRARFQEDIGDNRAMQTNPSPNTQMPNHSNADPAELAKFSELAHRWWDKNSEFKFEHEKSFASVAEFKQKAELYADLFLTRYAKSDLY